jgi:predicted RNase H-like HicB family nuclease
MFKYEIVIYWSEDDQAFIAEVPELPGCAAHGASQDEALGNCKQAMAHWVDTAKQAGHTIPTPSGRRLRLV